MNMDSIGVINQRSPYGNNAGKDAQDLALIFGSYEQEVSVYFIGDGVYHLLADQDMTSLGVKDYAKTYDAFPFYDIEQVYVCEASLQERNIKKSEIKPIATILPASKISSNLTSHKAIFTF